MKALALAVNPLSGTDVRRFSSYASSSSFSEKLQIALRLVSVAHALGVTQCRLMPDHSGMADAIAEKLIQVGVAAEIYHMPVGATANDTSAFTAAMRQADCGCLITLGGDGTARAAAKSCGDLPLLPLSTGTNNVYPYLTEGTAAGMAAAAVASGRYAPEHTCIRDKRIEVAINGVFSDIALIDAVVSSNRFTGAKAIQRLDELLCLIVTRCHPATIGFSSIVGCRCLVRDTDDFGAQLWLHQGSEYYAPVSSGVLERISSGEPRLLALEETLDITAPCDGTVALDGEREITFRQGERLTFRLTRNGPHRVDIGKTCEHMLLNNGFRPDYKKGG